MFKLLDEIFTVICIAILYIITFIFLIACGVTLYNNYPTAMTWFCIAFILLLGIGVVGYIFHFIAHILGYNLQETIQKIDVKNQFVPLKQTFLKGFYAGLKRKSKSIKNTGNNRWKRNKQPVEFWQKFAIGSKSHRVTDSLPRFCAK